MVFDTPKDDEIKQPLNVEKDFEERKVRKALMDGLDNLKIKNFTHQKTGKNDFSITYSDFGKNDINTGIFLLARFSFVIKKIASQGKITEKSEWKNTPVDSVLILGKIRIPSALEKIIIRPERELFYEKKWNIEIAKTDEYTISVTFPKTLENRMVYIQAETIDGRLMDPGAFTTLPVTDFEEYVIKSVGNISIQLRLAKFGDLSSLGAIPEKDFIRYKKVRQLFTYAEHSAKKNQNNPKFDLMKAFVSKGNELELLSENKKNIYAQFSSVPAKAVLIFGKNDKEIQSEQWIIK